MKIVHIINIKSSIQCTYVEKKLEILKLIKIKTKIIKLKLQAMANNKTVSKTICFADWDIEDSL